MSADGEPRVVLVTGGAQGIGRAFAKRFVRDGYFVVVGDVQGERAAEVAEELGGPQAAVAVSMDVSAEESVADAVELGIEHFGGIDVLINSAAIFSSIEMKPFDEISMAEWRRVIDVNLTGTFLCCRAVTPTMRARGGGAILNISSATVLMGRANYAHYVSSKAGVIGLTRALARELGESGVTVNAIMPGSTETEVSRSTVSASQAADIVGRQAIPRRLQVDDIVGSGVFLASSEARSITGQTIVVDGGINFV